MQSSKEKYRSSNDELRRARQQLRPRGLPIEEAGERIYDEPEARPSEECSSPPHTAAGPEYYNQIMITYLRSKESQHGKEEGATAMMPPGAKPIPLPKPKKSMNDNTDNWRFFPTGFPIEEEEENIYDQPNTGVEYSSPPPTGPEYYNQSIISYFRSKESQRGREEGATAMMPPATKPIPPPKQKNPTNNTVRVPFLTQVEVLTCDSSGREYCNYNHGIMLRIPDDAIPPGMIIHLEVAVALYGPFQFPDGSCPISPILWLCIQENVDLRKPIDIILPHFLVDAKNFGIRFAKADHKRYADKFGRNYYIFEPLETAFIAYKERNQNYGILSTQHCCYLCIISNDPQISPDFALKAGYYLWCIEEPSSNSMTTRVRDTLHFCATFCLPTCREMLKSQYTEKEGYYIRRPPKMFAFKDSGDTSDSCLSIKVKDEGCVMAADPENKMIKASQIYFWDKRDQLELLQADKVYPPNVTLTLEVLENLPVKLLIKFNGSTADNDMNMEIMLPLASAGSKSHVGPTSSATIDHESLWTTTDKPELSSLLRELIKVDSEWENIGILLEIESHRLESIKTAEHHSTLNCLREMLKIWLKKINPPPSWSAITDALKCLREEQLAHDLRSKYIH